MAILADLGAGFFFLPWLSTVSSERGKIMGGPRLRVQGRGNGIMRRTLGEVVCFIWRVGGSSLFWEWSGQSV